MKKRILLVLILVLFLALLTSCANIGNDANNTKDLPMAKWDGNTFVSEWAGFKIIMPQGWSKATDDEIRAVNQLDSKAYVGATGESKDKFKDANAIYPMLILKYPLNSVPAFNTNIILVYEKLNAASDLLVKDANSYLSIVRNQLEPEGYTIGENEERVVGGLKYASFFATIEGSELKQLYLARKHDGYVISIIITGTSANPTEIDDLLKNIVKL